jgi:hypothetical protein
MRRSRTQRRPLELPPAICLDDGQVLPTNSIPTTPSHCFGFTGIDECKTSAKLGRNSRPHCRSTEKPSVRSAMLGAGWRAMWIKQDDKDVAFSKAVRPCSRRSYCRQTPSPIRGASARSGAMFPYVSAMLLAAIEGLLSSGSVPCTPSPFHSMLIGAKSATLAATCFIEYTHARRCVSLFASNTSDSGTGTPPIVSRAHTGALGVSRIPP